MFQKSQVLPTALHLQPAGASVSPEPIYTTVWLPHDVLESPDLLEKSHHVSLPFPSGFSKELKGHLAIVGRMQTLVSDRPEIYGV